LIAFAGAPGAAAVLVDELDAGRFKRASDHVQSRAARQHTAFEIAEARSHEAEIKVKPFVPRAKNEPQPSLL
jgi:hypothetical protein